MDGHVAFLVGRRLWKRYQEKKRAKESTLQENFTQDSTQSSSSSGGFDFVILLVWIVNFIIGVGAAWLSWRCNTDVELFSGSESNIFLKIVFAIFAFLFGYYYIMFYLFLKVNMCHQIHKYVKDNKITTRSFKKAVVPKGNAPTSSDSGDIGGEDVSDGN